MYIEKPFQNYILPNNSEKSLSFCIDERERTICSCSARSIANLSTNVGPCSTTILGLNCETLIATRGDRPKPTFVNINTRSVVAPNIL